ncbi:MAG: phosphatidylserine/phosphatidylglycerophosphate/cardiolipin synthase family protein [Candidatus Riflebacteria bacterium]|nr:phosphatidylserine/phosphatidylglycerophosphate/cardiolipin synthase family protein [Candidatus Riflebacteria bacterium]
MRTSTRLVLLFIVCLWLTPVAGLWAADDSRALYDQYLASYKKYQDAVSAGASEDEVKQLAAAFNQARAAYEQSVSGGQTATPDNEWSSSEDQSLPLPGRSSGTSSGTGSGSSDQKAPAALTSTLKELWSSNGRKVADKAIKVLDRYIAANPDSTYAVKAKYEVAKAYEYLKGDNEASTKVLNDIAGDPRAGAYAKLAQDRLKYLDACRQYSQWKTVLTQKRNAMDAAYSSYRNTSWLAFPVRGARWVGYVGKLISFQKAQNDFEEFELKFEELAAPYVPPVDVAFDLFKTANGSEDESATVRLVYDNNQGWYARWKLINEARSSIDLQYFIVEDDIFGMALCGALLKKAREGIKIRFMMDARGTKGFTRKLMGQDFIQELVAFPNVEVKVFNPVHTNLATMLLDIRKIMSSNHDKIVVVDEEYAVIGGRNVSSHYFVLPEDMPECYRDCDVVIHSPAVAKQLAYAFEEEFKPLKQYSIQKDLWGNIDIMSKELEAALKAMDFYIRGDGLFQVKGGDKRTVKALTEYNAELSQYKLMTRFESFSLLEGSHVAAVKIIDKHSLFGERNDITDQLVKFIDGARQEIIIQNPYVVLTERAEAALKRAAKRGVRIYIHTNSPASTDSLATQAMFYGDWKRILKEIHTCRIFTYYGKRKLHAKNFCFDGKLGIIGTYNMDYMSEDINSEVVAAIKSTAFARELRTEIFGDIAQSKEYKISVDANGKVHAVFGPDDLPGKNTWLMKVMSKMTFIKKLI